MVMRSARDLEVVGRAAYLSKDPANSAERDLTNQAYDEV